MEGNNQSSKAKTIAIVAYITLIGWIVALVMHSNESQKSSLASFHIRQSLGLILTGIVGSIVLSIMPILTGTFLSVWYLLIFILVIIGIISAVNEEQKPLPVVGDFYQKIFSNLV